MSRTAKIVIAAVIAVGAISTVAYSIVMQSRGALAVEVTRSVRQNLTQSVTASGEIKPLKYVNISSNMMGRIVDLPVREGDRVKEGELLVRLEAVQTLADVQSAQASLEGAMSDLEGMDSQIRSAEAALNTARADIGRAEADSARASQAFARAQKMHSDGLISREQFDRQKADTDIATAGLNSARARVSQAEAQLAQARKQKDGVSFRVTQQRAMLTRVRDQYSKSTIYSPLAGVITNLPVHAGEIAIVGVQNQAGTVLMTIADMSVITAEVKVDETDIINLRLGQPAEIKVDALPDRVLNGHVSEIGNSALTRSGGISTTTTTQEAKDFKVVVTLDNPPPELRPGLSSTATIVTATRESALSVPIQALVIREEGGTIANPAGTPITQGSGSGSALAAMPPASASKKKVEIQGVFLLEDGIALFRPVKTGIMGTTDIEVLEGLKENDSVVSGPYKVLRELQNNTRVRIERVIS